MDAEAISQHTLPIFSTKILHSHSILTITTTHYTRNIPFLTYHIADKISWECNNANQQNDMGVDVHTTFQRHTCTCNIIHACIHITKVRLGRQHIFEYQHN